MMEDTFFKQNSVVVCSEKEMNSCEPKSTRDLFNILKFLDHVNNVNLRANTTRLFVPTTSFCCPITDTLRAIYDPTNPYE